MSTKPETIVVKWGRGRIALKRGKDGVYRNGALCVQASDSGWFCAHYGRFDGSTRLELQDTVDDLREFIRETKANGDAATRALNNLNKMGGR